MDAFQQDTFFMYGTGVVGSKLAQPLIQRKKWSNYKSLWNSIVQNTAHLTRKNLSSEYHDFLARDMREFLLWQRRRGSSSGSISASAHWRSGGSIYGGALAHQLSGQRHSGAAAVAAAAMAAAAAVDSGQRCSSSGAGAAPSGLGFALAARGASSSGSICGGALAQQPAA